MPDGLEHFATSISILLQQKHLAGPFTLPTMFPGCQCTTIFWMLVLVSHHSSGYELQDTIHNLEEENIHLQHQLENLTHALRDLKHLLTEHSKGECSYISVVGCRWLIIYCSTYFTLNSFWWGTWHSISACMEGMDPTW